MNFIRMQPKMIQFMILMYVFNCISCFHITPNRVKVNSPTMPQISRSTSSVSTDRYRTITQTNIANAIAFKSPPDSSIRSIKTLLRQSSKSDAEIPIEEGFNTNTRQQFALDLDEASSQTEAKKVTVTPTILNACLLAICFGFAFYSILNVDAGMTRGWSITEKAMRIPLDNWASYESSLNTQPITTKTMINVIIYLLGDWLSQTVFIRKNVLEFDALRTLRNGLIGLVFGPLVHEYYQFSDYILPVEEGWNRLYKIIMDQTIYLFVKCIMYIVAVNMLAGESFEFSFDTAKSKIKGIMFTAWKFWPLAHCITYNAIPARHRILWVNCVDLFWNAILALKASNSTDDEDDDIGGIDEDAVASVTRQELPVLSDEHNMDIEIGLNKDALEELSRIIAKEMNGKEETYAHKPESDIDISEETLFFSFRSNETVAVEE